MKPAFMVLGAQRCGTTFLWSMLREHPELYVPPTKELHVFCGAPCGGAESGGYSRIFENVPAELLAGDFTPDYIYFPWVPPLIRDSVGQIPTIVLLRDPVDRAFSHYWLERRQGREWRTFEQALKSESRRIVKSRTGIRDASYVQRGMYADQIARLHKYFQADSILILQAEELYRNPSGVLAQVCRHIGVSPPAPSTVGSTSRNEARRPQHDLSHRIVTLARVGLRGRDGTSTLRAAQRRLGGSEISAMMSPGTQVKLTEVFRQSNERLQDLTGLGLTGWAGIEP